MINVTKTYLPEIEEYYCYLKGIWERCWLTNYGPLVVELEKNLKEYLGVKHLFFVNNGTLALQLAIRSLDLKGEIVTTPFSYVATTSSIVWEGCTPVFVDIEKESLCINPDLIEASITPNTVAILATHVYGNPSNVEKIAVIAKTHHLKLLYDSAHAFGVMYGDKSILNYGDVSTLSFHATKLFHTVEGGAIITEDDDLAFKLSYMVNFGHNGPEKFYGLGINGKNSEFHAAMGLCILPKVSSLIAKRKQVSELYDNLLLELGLQRPVIRENVQYNYAYYPVIFSSEENLLSVQKQLNANDIFPRRYFYPALSTLNYVKSKNCKIAEEIAPRIMCLPLYHDITDDSIYKIAGIIKSCL
jgi:dTDP-4-amino-4,6-dideoxygalactose transaminase